LALDSTTRYVALFSYQRSVPLRDLHSFPTRRSSDLSYELCHQLPVVNGETVGIEFAHKNAQLAAEFMREIVKSEYREKHAESARDRKSTRLNSSHQIISYAVFCLKKKRKKQQTKQER